MCRGCSAYSIWAIAQQNPDELAGRGDRDDRPAFVARFERQRDARHGERHYG